MSTFSTTYQVELALPALKKCTRMTCVGWVKSLSTPNYTSLYPMAIADLYEDIETSDNSIKMEIYREGYDYRLMFFGSKSKLIDRNIKINVNDGYWHFLSYESLGDGIMRYSVDGVELEPESILEEDGLTLDIARSRAFRAGGGSIYSPYLYLSGQAIHVCYWRMARGLNLGLPWIRELMEADRQNLSIFTKTTV